MIKFVKQPDQETKQLIDLFEDEWGQYRYVNAEVTALDDTNEQFNSNDTGYYRGSVTIEGDDVPSRTLTVFSSMLKDVKVGDKVLCRVRASRGENGTIYLSVQFSYGEGGSQNAIDEATATDAWGFDYIGAPAQETGKKTNLGNKGAGAAAGAGRNRK